MKIHLALYDPSYIGVERNYWTWRSSSIPERILGAIYYDCLIKQKPERPENITGSDLFGGALLLQDWVVIYRFYNGGRDTHGRPGRYVILTGWIKRDEVEYSTPSNVFSSEIFEMLASVPPPCPTPAPDSLDVDISCNPIKRHSASIKLVDGQYEFPANTNVTTAVEDFFSLIGHSGKYQLIINQSNNINRLVIQKIEEQKEASVTSQVNDAPKPEPESQLNSSTPFFKFQSDNPEQTINSEDNLNQKEDNMSNSQINYFNTLVLLVVIAFMSLLFVKQSAIQKQIKHNEEVIRSIQQLQQSSIQQLQQSNIQQQQRLNNNFKFQDIQNDILFIQQELESLDNRFIENRKRLYSSSPNNQEGVPTNPSGKPSNKDTTKQPSTQIPKQEEQPESKKPWWKLW